MDRQFRSLQALRGVACLMVVFFHVGNWEPSTRPENLLLSWVRPFGWAGVDLFFVLSGFIIAWTQDANLGRPAAVRSYIGRRLWRVYPIYLATWLATAVAMWALLGVPLGYGNGARACWNQLVLWPWNNGNHYLPVAWSLTFEVFFYGVFAFFIAVPRQWFTPLLMLWTTMVLGNQLVRGPTAPTWLLIAPLVLEFQVGCWTAVAFRRRSGGAGLALAVGTAVIAAAVAGLGVWSVPSSPWRAVCLGPPAGLVVYALADLERSGRLRPPNWLCRIGDASYSIYLVHYPVGLIFLVKTLGWSQTGWRHPAWAGLIVAAMLGSGYLWHLGVERPLLRLGHRRKAPGLTPQLPIADQPDRRAA
jgi:exopolysaccharide production protein ExoZ